jgi:hypothetical protein
MLHIYGDTCNVIANALILMQCEDSPNYVIEKVSAHDLCLNGATDAIMRDLYNLVSDDKNRSFGKIVDAISPAIYECVKKDWEAFKDANHEEYLAICKAVASRNWDLEGYEYAIG